MKESQIKILGDQSSPEKLSRRAMAGRLLVGLGAGLAGPLLSASHPLARHLADTMLLSEADSRIARPDWKPLFLSETQHAALESLSETIVPGSTKAHVSRFIDLLLSADTPKNRQRFLASLAAIDGESARRYSRDFAALNAAERRDLVAAVSSAPRSGHAGSPLRAHFDNLKQWISGAYYSSEEGMRELGWTPDRVFSEFPGCTHPEGHS